MEFNFTKSQLETLQKLVEYPDDFKYPVGTILASDDIHAVDNIGGQWDQIEDRFLLGAGSTFAVNSAGGEATHKLSTAEMPTHTHRVAKGGVVSDSSEYFANNDTIANAVSTAGKYWYSVTRPVGSGEAHNNMPPYMAKYMWIKTKLQSELEGENV